jgi:hypothetical protein
MAKISESGVSEHKKNTVRGKARSFPACQMSVISTSL